MTALKMNTIITGIRARVDGSLGLTLETPELNKEEKVAVMELQNVNCLTLFHPIDGEGKEIKEVKGELSKKSQSSRIRSTLFILWKQRGEQEPFETFYFTQTEKIIDRIKSLLEEV